MGNKPARGLADCEWLWAAVRLLHETGWSVRRIADECGSNYHTVSRAIRAAGGRVVRRGQAGVPRADRRPTMGYAGVRHGLKRADTPPQERVFTTGQVARMCRVAPRTVSKWFDAGKLGGYRIPGSDDRRVPLGKLRAFGREYGIPLVGLDDGTILVCGLTGPERAALVGTAVGRVVACDTPFEAGIQMGGACPPTTVVIDLAFGLSAVRPVATLLATDPRFRSTELIAVVTADAEEGLAADLTTAGFDLVVCRPADWAAVLGRPGQRGVP